MSIVTCRSHLSCGVPQLLKNRRAETLFHYIGGANGHWRVTNIVTCSGPPLRPVRRVEIANGHLSRVPAGCRWVLRGVVDNTRYVTREDRCDVEPVLSPVGQSEATCAALIPIRKSDDWWNLAADERLEIQAERSRQLARESHFLPAIVRPLQTSRGLGEPFDFVTWFEYSPHDASIFDDLVAALRASSEWQYVEREIDIRLVRDGA